MTTWTDDRVEELKRLWKAGHSVSSIAIQLKGVSRNAVMGKVWRLGLDKRPTAVRVVKTRPKFRPAVARAAMPGGFNLRLRTTASRPALDVDIMDLKPGMCKWPTSSGRPHRFCGQPWLGAGPYCAAHTAIAHHHRPMAFTPEEIAARFEERIAA